MYLRLFLFVSAFVLGGLTSWAWASQNSPEEWLSNRGRNAHAAAEENALNHEVQEPKNKGQKRLRPIMPKPKYICYDLLQQHLHKYYGQNFGQDYARYAQLIFNCRSVYKDFEKQSPQSLFESYCNLRARIRSESTLMFNGPTDSPEKEAAFLGSLVDLVAENLNLYMSNPQSYNDVKAVLGVLAFVNICDSQREHKYMQKLYGHINTCLKGLGLDTDMWCSPKASTRFIWGDPPFPKINNEENQTVVDCLVLNHDDQKLNYYFQSYARSSDTKKQKIFFMAQELLTRNTRDVMNTIVSLTNNKYSQDREFKKQLYRLAVITEDFFREKSNFNRQDYLNIANYLFQNAYYETAAYYYKIAQGKIAFLTDVNIDQARKRFLFVKDDVQLAHCHYHLKRFGVAATFFKNVLESDIDMEAAGYARAGYCLAQSMQYDLALDCYKKAHTKKMDFDLENCLMIANSFYFTKKYDAAYYYFKKVIGENPTASADTYLKAAKSLYYTAPSFASEIPDETTAQENRDYTQAAYYYSTALKMNPDLILVNWVEVTDCYMRIKDYKAALLYYNEAHARHIDFPAKTWFNVAKCYFFTGDHDVAERIFQLEFAKGTQFPADVNQRAAENGKAIAQSSRVADHERETAQKETEITGERPHKYRKVNKLIILD